MNGRALHIKYFVFFLDRLVLVLRENDFGDKALLIQYFDVWPTNCFVVRIIDRL